jgi:hypothetical protein
VYQGETSESRTALAFSPLILSHQFSRSHSRCGPGAAQTRPKDSAIKANCDEGRVPLSGGVEVVPPIGTRRRVVQANGKDFRDLPSPSFVSYSYAMMKAGGG